MRCTVSSGGSNLTGFSAPAYYECVNARLEARGVPLHEVQYGSEDAMALPAVLIFVDG